MRDIGQRLYEFIQNYQQWRHIWLPQRHNSTALLYAPTRISKSLSGFPPLLFTLLSNTKFRSVVALQEGEERAGQGPFLGWMWYLWIYYRDHSKTIHSNGSSQNSNPIPVAFPHHLEIAMPMLGGQRKRGRHCLPKTSSPKALQYYHRY